MSYECVRAVLEQSEQTGSARLLLLVIAEHADKNGVSYPGNELLAQESKMSVRQVQRVIKQLADTNELKILEPGDGRGKKRIMKVQLTKGDIAMSPFVEEKKGDIQGEKGDISGQKGDIQGEKGDIAMSPEPYNQLTNNISSPKSEAIKPPKDAKLPTEHQRMFEAICHCVGWDYHIIDKSQKGQVAQTLGILSKAGYTISDLRAFYAHWKHQDWRGQKGQLPTLKELRAEIGKVKLKSSPILEGNNNGHSTLSTFNGSEK